MTKHPIILWTLTAPPPRGTGTDLEFVHLPFIRIDLLTGAVDPERLAICRSAVVTSRWAVAALAPHRDALARLPIVAIGEGTRKQLLAAGGSEITAPAQATGSDLVKLLKEQPPPPPVFFPHGNLGGEEVQAYLEATDTDHYSPVVYRTIERSTGDLRRLLAGGANLSAVALGSPSAVSVWQKLKLNRPIATIGPTTSQACRQAGLEVWREARAGDPVDLARQFTDRFGESLRPA